MYTSTRKNCQISGMDAIIKGISDDGGLFIRDDFSKFSFTKDLMNLSYIELGAKILQFFFDDFSYEELLEVMQKAYGKNNFLEKIVDLKSFDDHSFLELFHGPTLAFKDMALTALPHLMSLASKKCKMQKNICILTATSGDTGGASLSGFKDTSCKMIVIYPTKGVSSFQEAQMQFFASENAKVFSVEGNFDDCQNAVKDVFLSKNDFKNLELTSANSINIGRLAPQVIYYFYSYFSLVKNKKIKYGEKINFVVPTGNFGNILACYLAKEMGLFIDKIVCATNENNVLTDFFNTLEYNKNREFHITNSPAMDILISSNLERLIYLISKSDVELINKISYELKTFGKYKLDEKYKNVFSNFLSSSITKEETIYLIKECFFSKNYLIDPHTAVAYGAYLKQKDYLTGHTVIISTASPLKFIETVNEIFGFLEKDYELVKKICEKAKIKIPQIITKIYEFDYQKQVLAKENLKERIIKIIGELDENCKNLCN